LNEVTAVRHALFGHGCADVVLALVALALITDDGKPDDGLGIPSASSSAGSSGRTTARTR
jgi:hypothetical protein